MSGYLEKRLLWVSGLLALFVAFIGAWTLFPDYHILNHVAGIWIAQGVDANEGVFYRPILSEEGRIGGTRYFPLPIALLSLSYRLGIPLVLGPQILSTIALFFFITATYLFLRNLKFPWEVAFPISLLLLCQEPVFATWQRATIDLIPSAFNLSALALLCGREKSGYKRLTLWSAGSLFALAFLSKFTTLYGLFAAMLYLWMNGNKKEILSLLLPFSLLSLLFLIAAEILSQGHFSHNLWMSAGGGMSLRSLFEFPRKLFLMYYDHNNFSLYVLMLASSAYFASSKAIKNRYVEMTFVMTCLMSFLILLSPGTDENHLLDVGALSLITAAYYLYHENKKICFILLFLWGTLASLWCGYKVFIWKETSEKEVIREIIEKTKGEGPLLSENPLIPLLAFERPYLTDEFMFKEISKSDEKLKDSLLKDVKSRKFRSILIIHWKKPYSIWYEKQDFGKEVTEAMMEHYEQVDTIGNYFILKPKQTAMR